MLPILRAASCHVSPIFLSAKDTTQKCISLIHEAARNRAHLVIFPETYIPAFPIWSSVLSPAENHHFFSRMAAESVYVNGEEVIAIRQAAKKSSIAVSVGISEKVQYSSATLFNSNLIIGPDGEILVHHRKLMPTFFEKLTWSPGDGHGLKVVDIDVPATRARPAGSAKLGMLICGENTNPLARYTLMAQGEQVHISTWPAIWPTRMAAPSNTAATGAAARAGRSSPGKNYDNISANKTRAAAHCFETKCFGILCAGHLPRSAISTILASAPESVKNSVSTTLETSSQAASMFLDPTGAQIPGFIIDPKTGERHERDMLRFEEGILYAELDMEACVEGKQYHDVVGGYQRLDVFDLKVDTRRRDPVTLLE